MVCGAKMRVGLAVVQKRENGCGTRQDVLDVVLRGALIRPLKFSAAKIHLVWSYAFPNLRSMLF